MIAAHLPSFPALVQDFTTPTKKTAGGKAMDNDHSKQRPWTRLEQIDQAKDNACQTYAAYAAPTPPAKSMIERIRCSAY